MSSPFSQILSGLDRTLYLAENEHFIAVLERQPLVVGHTVLISKRFEDHLFDLSEGELASLGVFSKHIANAIQKVIRSEKVGMAALGLQTRHAHVHLVPINSPDDLNFTRAKLSPTTDELVEVLAKIKAVLKS